MSALNNTNVNPLNVSGKISGVPLKPPVKHEPQLFDIHKGSGSNIRQSYDSSHKNISLGALNTIGSKKSVRGQHRRQKRSREDSMPMPSTRKRKDSRLFKKSFGGPAIKLNLNSTGVSLNQNAFKNYKLPF
jgi:hypothetical protein